MANATCPLAEQFQYVVIVKEMLITPQHSDPHWNAPTRSDYIPAMGFNKRKMETPERPKPTRRPRRGVGSARKSLRTPGPSRRRCCSCRRSAPLLPRGIGSCGYAARPAALRTRSTCAHSTVIPTRRSRALSPRRSADHADRMPLCRTGAAVAIERTGGVERGARQGRVGQVDRCNGVLPVTAELASRP